MCIHEFAGAPGSLNDDTVALFLQTEAPFLRGRRAYLGRRTFFEHRQHLGKASALRNTPRQVKKRQSVARKNTFGTQLARENLRRAWL